MKCISGAKIPPPSKTSVCYNSVSQNAITDIQIVILTNTPKIVEIFYGIKLGLNLRAYVITAIHSERFQNYSKIKRKDFCVLPLFVYIDFKTEFFNLIFLLRIQS